MARRTPEPDPKPKRRFGRRRQRPDGELSGFQQFRQVIPIIRRNDKRALPISAAIFVVVLGILIGVGFLVGHPIALSILGVAFGALAALNFFGWRGRKAVFAEVGDQKGIALEVVRRLRGDWKITEAVQFTRNQDFVHRIVGRPGIVLIAEGRPQAARELLITEARRIKRVAAEVPVHEVIIGDRPGDVTIGKLSNYMSRLPRKLGKDQVRTLDVKLKAVGGTNIGLPKGPLPTHVKRPKIR